MLLLLVFLFGWNIFAHSTGAAMRHRCASISDAHNLCKYIAPISQRLEKAEYNPDNEREERGGEWKKRGCVRVVDRSNKHARIRARGWCNNVDFVTKKVTRGKVRCTAICVRLMAHYPRCDSYKHDFNRRMMGGFIFSERVFMRTELFFTDIYNY